MTRLTINVITKDQKETHIEVNDLPKQDIIALVEKTLGISDYIPLKKFKFESFDEDTQLDPSTIKVFSRPLEVPIPPFPNRIDTRI